MVADFDLAVCPSQGDRLGLERTRLALRNPGAYWHRLLRTPYHYPIALLAGGLLRRIPQRYRVNHGTTIEQMY